MRPATEPRKRLTILCSGYLVRYPVGGHSWHHFQYLLGLRRLGHEVVFFEDYGWPDSCYDPGRGAMTSDPAYGIAYVTRLMRRYGLDGCWCYLAEDGRAYGMPRDRLAAVCATADLYLNLSNVNWIPELDQCRHRVLVDTDPGLTQLGAHGLGKPLAWYHALVTYGENIGTPRSAIPTGGLVWHPTRQPVVIDQWAGAAPGGRVYTTVGKWNSVGRDVTWAGQTYGWSKRAEWLRFVDLPARTGVPFELAMNVDPADAPLLAAHGWRFTDPRTVSRDPWRYQRYVQASRGEFTVAKDLNVRLRSGWLGDRSPCYLAAGRPVVMQDTGFGDVLPLGPGLHAVHTVEEAAEALAVIEADYARACAHASEVARAHFSADRVLGDLLRVAGLEST
jgi:hypothetical protein